MDFIIDGISNLIAEFLLNTSSIQSLGSTFPTTIAGTGSVSSEIGTILIDSEKSDSFMQTIGMSITATGTEVSLNADSK